MLGIKKGGGIGEKYLATTLPPQTKLTATAKVTGTTAKVDFFVEKVQGEQLNFLKEYIVVVNENHIPTSPTDGRVFTIGKGAK